MIKFYIKYIYEIFKDNKRVSYTNPQNGGEGISQNDNSVPTELKLDLNSEDWFVFTDHYGTEEEKAFIAYFKEHVDVLRNKYDKIYLLRNERQLKLYSFEGGERFEPDFVLFLKKYKNDGFEQLQIFIEPKGKHLLEQDAWKEKFLLELLSNSIPIIKFKDDNNYRIWGFHFFNREKRFTEFDNDFNVL